MSERFTALAVRLARPRIEVALEAVRSADLPAGLTAEREGDAVVIRGPGLVRALALDARLRGLAGVAGGR